MAHPPAISKQPTPHSLLRRMSGDAHALRKQLGGDLASGRNHSLSEARSSLTAELGRDLTFDEAADILAQAAICAAPILNSPAARTGAALPWLIDQLVPWERSAVQMALSLSPPLLVSPSIPSPAHLYDVFLHHYHRDHRKRRGVFFTPQPIADYIVREIDQLLRDEFALADGLAHSAICNSQSAIPLLLDPAAGTGVFLLAAIDHIHRALTSRWQAEGTSAAEILRRWNDYVPTLLPRLFGIEILPAPALLAKLNIALKLAETGYEFNDGTPINILLRDALSPSPHSAISNLQSPISIPILLGNPPFSSLSTNSNDWIARLVRGDDEIRGYVRANGQRLNERKTWLHDDYVKFIRLAQWYVEEAGAGIVGFVTNHGYLDNATFRLMRQELLRVFPHIRIVDLHGSRKKYEISPDGSPDENIFGLDQGLAISLLSQPTIPTRSVSEGPRIEHTDLWGSREQKLRAISEMQRGSPSLALRASVLRPSAPDWRLVPAKVSAACPEYDRAWSLADAMPLNTTAPVTARDKFVVGFTEEELRQRIEEFRDLSIPDDEIRRRYFTRTRSARHQPGDTRGWKLSEARRIIAEDDDWQRHIIPCLYRPFDTRFVFWHPAMIDWPRAEVTRHLIKGSGFGVQGSANSEFRIQNSESDSPPNSAFCILHPALCLIARRQQLPGHPCTFFSIADGLALDGVIRSDNRGSESLFPLYLRGNPASGEPTWRANFAAEFVQQVAQRIELTWLPLGRGDLSKTFGPADLLAYIYALFHAPGYRQRYADALRTAFPRVLLPSNCELFASLSQLGRELIDLHTAEESRLPTGVPSSDDAQDFRVGGYQVLKKWLQPPHRSPNDPEFQHIAAAIARTIEIMRQIDAATKAHGGFRALSEFA